MGKIIEALATELSQYRALTAEESAALARAIEKPLSPFRRWTYSDDARLQQMLRTRMKVREIADAMGRTPWAVYTRVRDLKRKAQR